MIKDRNLKSVRRYNFLFKVSKIDVKKFFFLTFWVYFVHITLNSKLNASIQLIIVTSVKVGQYQPEQTSNQPACASVRGQYSLVIHTSIFIQLCPFKNSFDNISYYKICIFFVSVSVNGLSLPEP